MSLVESIFSIIILIFSVVIHEVSHGFTAYMLGDNTARYQGRLTLNPFKHLEWFGSFILPFITYMSGGFILGWAKPVPFNPYNLRNQRWGEALVAIAGPLSNIFIALVFGLILRFNEFLYIFGPLFAQSFFGISYIIVVTNLVLAVFNLVPIAPLDGSKIIFSIFPNSLWKIRNYLETYGPFLLIFFIFSFGDLLKPIVSWLFINITGLRI